MSWGEGKCHHSINISSCGVGYSCWILDRICFPHGPNLVPKTSTWTHESGNGAVLIGSSTLDQVKDRREFKKKNQKKIILKKISRCMSPYLAQRSWEECGMLMVNMCGTNQKNRIFYSGASEEDLWYVHRVHTVLCIEYLGPNLVRICV